jgi:hypothetical protein
MQPAQRLEGEPGCIAPSISSLFTGPETPTELPGPYEQEVTTVYLYVLILGSLSTSLPGRATRSPTRIVPGSSTTAYTPAQGNKPAAPTWTLLWRVSARRTSVSLGSSSWASVVLRVKKRADERTRTADLISLRVRFAPFTGVHKGSVSLC